MVIDPPLVSVSFRLLKKAITAEQKYMKQTSRPDLSGITVDLTPKAWLSLSAETISAAQQAVNDINRNRLCKRAMRYLSASFDANLPVDARPSHGRAPRRTRRRNSSSANP